MIKKYLHILFFLAILSHINSSFATSYEEYENNVVDVCDTGEYKNDKVYKKTGFYLKAEDYKNDLTFGTYFTNTIELFTLDGVERIYRDIQNDIYKCGMYQSQMNAYDRALIAIKREKKGLLIDAIEETINSKKALLTEKIEKNACKLNKEEKLSKSQILDQSTYELCNYIFYLDYLDNGYYSVLSNITGFSTGALETIQDKADSENENQSIQTQLIADKISSIKQNIENEKQHSYKMYNMAFSAFSEYDSFLAIHIMLEIIKQDYIIFRDTLYTEISPINQVGYKIINAMSK